MVQNVQHWLLDWEQFPWAHQNLTEAKWFQVTKYFPGYKLRRQMVYVDAESGQPISAEGGEEVPQGRVYLYGLDLRNFCEIEVPGLNDAMTATRKSRMEARAGHGEAPAGASSAAGAAAAETSARGDAPAGDTAKAAAPGGGDGSGRGAH
jgi:hypothetical protein